MKIKKLAYHLLAIFIGILLSYITHALVEIWYLARMEKLGNQIIWYKHFGVAACALPPYLQYGILALGILGGLILGKWGWAVVYEKKKIS